MIVKSFSQLAVMDLVTLVSEKILSLVQRIAHHVVMVFVTTLKVSHLVPLIVLPAETESAV